MTTSGRFIACAVCLLALFVGMQRAQSPTGSKSGVVQQELVHTEVGFFEAWKTKDLAYFRSHIPENGVYWSDQGTLSREQQLSEQEDAAKNCTVEGFSLSDFGVLPLAAGTYLLTYKAEQYATCAGQKIPAHLNGSSVYIFKQGRWQAVYRATVPLRNQN